MKFRELAMSVAAVMLLVGLLALVDARVRDRIAGMNTRTVSTHLADGSAQIQSATMTLRERAVGNATLTLVVIAGAVLFVCMLRT